MSKRTIILIFSALALIFVSYLSFKNDREQEQEQEPEPEQEQEPEQEPEPELKVIKPKKSKTNEPIQENADTTTGEKPE
jgi:flagellar biosynthesis/type III secretory pathway M-ring protein FliF/YscJ